MLTRLRWRTRLALIAGGVGLCAAAFAVLTSRSLATNEPTDDAPTLAAIDALAQSGAIVRRMAVARALALPLVGQFFKRTSMRTEVWLEGDHICEVNLDRLRSMQGPISLKLIRGHLNDAWIDYIASHAALGVVTVECTADSESGRAIVAQYAADPKFATAINASIDQHKRRVAQAIRADGSLPAK